MKLKLWIEYDYADKMVIAVSEHKIEDEVNTRLPWIRIFTKVINVPVLAKWDNKTQSWISKKQKQNKG